MINPWVILGVIAVWLASIAGTYYEAAKITENRITAAQMKATDKAVADAKADAEVDYGVQQQLALEAQKHDLLKTQKHAGVVKATQADPASVSCRMSDATFSVLNDSLTAADAASPAASAVDGAVPGVNPSGRPKLGGGDVRAGQHGVDPLDVQAGSQQSH